MYAKNTTGTWNIETVDLSICWWYGHASLALDSNDKPHIAYYSTSYHLMYAKNTTGTWEIEAPDPYGDKGPWTSISIDSNDKPHIAYFNWDDNDVMYAKNITGAWEIETAATNFGMYLSMALDSNDKPHISYLGDDPRGYWYAKNTTGTWETELIETSGDENIGLGAHAKALALNSNDKPHVVYPDYANQDFHYAEKTTGIWKIETVASAGDVGHHPTLDLDSDDKPHIAFCDYTNAVLKYAENTTGAWNIETVVDVGSSAYGYWPTICFGSVHITYMDNDNGYLKHASEAVTPTIVSISPSAQTVEKGETFTISVYVEPAEDIMGVSFDYLYFDPTLIHANSVTEGNLFDPHPTLFNAGIIDNVNGKITDVYGSTALVQTVNETGYFCNISFTAQQQLGTSDLDLDGVAVSDAAGNPVPIAVNDGEVTVWEYFEYFDLTMSVVGSGTTTPAAGVHSYLCGTVVDLEAFADTCWSFAGWSGSITTTDNPTTITMDSNKAVTATCTEIYYDLTINIVGSGTTTPAAGVHSYLCGTDVPLEAFPDFGWSFSGWSGDIDTTDNPTTITMDSDKIVTATFKEEWLSEITIEGTLTPPLRIDMIDYVIFGEKATASDGVDGYDLPYPGSPPAPYVAGWFMTCLLYTSPSPRDRTRSRMPSSA